MTDLTEFFSHAWKTLAHAVARAGVKAGLYKAPEVISKTLKRRVSAELKRLGVLLRRLIFLMALKVELAPLVPRPASNYFEKTEGAPKAHKPFFALVPTPSSQAPDFLHGPILVPDRGPVPAAGLINRWEAMLAVLKYSKQRAKRLARTIQRWKAKGEAKPYIAPVPKTHLMPAALGLVSGGLTVQLIAALKDWPDPDTS